MIRTISHLRRSVRAVAACLALLFAGSLPAQVQIFMKIADAKSPWAGTETAKDHEGWTRVKSMEFNAELAVSFGGSGGGATVGKATLKNISVTKNVDQITPALFGNLVRGLALNAGIADGDVIFDFVRPLPDGKDVYTFFRIELKNVYVTKLTSTGSDGDGTPEEQLEFAYGAIRQTFWPLNSVGTPAAGIAKSWNVVTNSDKF